MRLLVIDNYDSFTWNLVHYLRDCGAKVEVARNDAISVDEAVTSADAFVISPGPGTPDDCAAGALFLCEPSSRFVTGTVLTVDGGWCVSEGQHPPAPGIEMS